MSRPPVDEPGEPVSDGSSAGRGRLVGEPLLVVSPHLDDAVLSAGCLLGVHPGSVVVTVLTADRPTGHGPTEWDRAGGLGAPDVNPPRVRRAEDQGALGMLGARPCWLNMLESQYGGTVDEKSITKVLASVLDAYPGTTAVMPLGLWHDEHVVVHRACRRLLRADPSRTWLAYADVPYRCLDGGQHLFARMRELRDNGVTLVPVRVTQEKLRAKFLALTHYRSQLQALSSPGRSGWKDALEPEQCWRLQTSTPPPSEAGHHDGDQRADRSAHAEHDGRRLGG